MKKINISLLFLIALIMQSCFKEDTKIAPHQTGDVTTSTVELGQNYQNQLYFNLKTNQTVSSNPKDDWDLEFGCSDTLMIVRLNSSKMMQAAAINDTAFTSITDTAGYNWTFDAASGNVDSLAIQKWYTINGLDTVFNQNTILIDRGVDAMGILQGLRKIKIIAYKNNTYTIKYSNLDNSDLQIIDVNTNESNNYVQLNLQNGSPEVALEPNKENWDLFFTQYTDKITNNLGVNVTYLVTGVLLNPYKVLAAAPLNIDFESIMLSTAQQMNLTKIENTIGYNWKSYNFNAASYVIDPTKVYVIKDCEGYYYKLHFIDFYNNGGQKGFPKFEFQKL